MCDLLISAFELYFRDCIIRVYIQYDYTHSVISIIGVERGIFLGGGLSTEEPRSRHRRRQEGLLRGGFPLPSRLRDLGERGGAEPRPKTGFDAFLASIKEHI